LAIAAVLWAVLSSCPPVQADLAQVVRDSGVQGGLVVRIGCDDPGAIASLRLNERFVVHALDVDAAKVAAAREAVRQAGLYGPVSADRFDGKKLPYVDNLVNLIVCEAACSVPKDELLRALAPGGVALVAGQKLVKPWPDDIDQWTHYLHDPGNNAVARDRAAQPRSIQWVAEPRWGRSHEELASMSAAVTANGRIFTIMDRAPLASIRFLGQWELTGRDAFSGVLLWTRKISLWSDHLRHFRAGPLHLPRRLVAVGDRVYVTLGLAASVSQLDAATGKTLREYPGTEQAEEIVVDGGVVYVAVSASEANRRGGGLYVRNEPPLPKDRFIAAYQADTGKQIWTKPLGPKEHLLPQTLAAAGEAIYYQDTTGLVKLNAADGKEQWRTPRQTPQRRMSFSAPTLVVREGVVLLADRNAGDKPGQAPAAGAVEWGVHGWGENGFDRKPPCTLRAYEAKTGKELWSAPCSEGYNSPVDVFVVGQTVWVGSDFTGYDLKTGQSKGKLNWKGAAVGMAHHRCYRDKATEQYILTGRSGVEVVSYESGWIGNNSWIRGTCQYGIMPANGLIYAPPDACACFGKVKQPGMFAAAGKRRADGSMPFAGEPLEKGPVYGESAMIKPTPGVPADWPMYRRDAARSGSVNTKLPDKLQPQWSARIGGRLTQPVVAGGLTVVSAIDTHTVHALDAVNGQPRWTFTAGGRVDSPPVLHAGMVYFGSADGYVYALRGMDGKLAWRFRAAPADHRTVAYEQVESVWPVHGAVLMQNGFLYASAGRSTYLDGGLVLYALDPKTGKQLHRHVVTYIDPQSDKQTAREGKGFGAFDMEGTATDVLSGDGESVFIKHLRFDAHCQPVKEPKPHLFAVTGFLGEEWFVRSYWTIAETTGAGWGHWTVPTARTWFGRIMSFNDQRVCGYGRVRILSGPTGHKADAYHLYAARRTTTAQPPAGPPGAAVKSESSAASDAPKAKGKKAKRAGKGDDQAKPKDPPKQYEWTDTNSLIARAMVLAGDKLVVAGPKDLGQKTEDILAFENEEEALAAFEGRRGVLLRVISAADGKQVFETPLPVLPVFDGLSAANGKLYMSLQDGSVQCWADGRD